MPDLFLAVVAGLISVLIAVYISRRGDQQAERQWQRDMEALEGQRNKDRVRDHNRREAEWVREAATAGLRADQEWRASLASGSREVHERRSRWHAANAAIVKLTAELPVAEAALASAQDKEAEYFARHGAHLQDLTVAVKQAQSRVTAITRDLGELHSDLDDLERAIKDTVGEVVHDTHTRWMQAKGLTEVLAPVLHDPLSDVERALQRLQHDLVTPSRSPDNSWSDADAAFTGMLASARREVERLPSE